MYYGPIELRDMVQIPVETSKYEVDLRICARVPAIVVIRENNDNEEPYISKVDKLLCILDDIVRDGGDEVEEVKNILNRLCNTRR